MKRQEIMPECMSAETTWSFIMDLQGMLLAAAEATVALEEENKDLHALNKDRLSLIDKLHGALKEIKERNLSPLRDRISNQEDTIIRQQEHITSLENQIKNMME